MVSVEEASAIVFSHLFKCRVETVPFSEAVNKVLAERIVADRDFPPFDRVAMDGIAIDFSAWSGGVRTFFIEDIQAAGMKRKPLKKKENCLEAMTGAVVPEGTDTIVRYEDVEIKEGHAHVLTATLVQGQNIHGQGQDAKAWSVLLEPGMLLSPAEIALLAAVGKSTVSVFCFPKTALVASGDELVDVDTLPEAHQIRRSNTFAIQAAMRRMGWDGTPFHLLDNKEQMRASLEKIAETFDVIILSGGVSKGKYDLVPEILQEMGVSQQFHKVSQKPGKPFWFGVAENGKVVFALPGNPVSTFMCFFRYIKPWLLSSVGVQQDRQQAILGKDFSFGGNVTYFLQVAVKNENGRLVAYPDSGGGSGDFANLKHVDGFLELPAHQNKFRAGEIFPYIPFRI
jgi:molybdopterin molybdotransferase